MMTSGIKKQNPLIQTTEIQQSLATDCILFQIKKKKKTNLHSDAIYMILFCLVRNTSTEPKQVKFWQRKKRKNPNSNTLSDGVLIYCHCLEGRRKGLKFKNNNIILGKPRKSHQSLRVALVKSPAYFFSISIRSLMFHEFSNKCFLRFNQQN